MTSNGNHRFHRDSHRRRLLSFRHRQIPVRALIPNMFTVLSMCAGLTAVRFAIEARYLEALALILVAGVIDGIDGRLARLLKAQSRFGAELDSLADFLSFGVAPAVLIYSWALGAHRSLGWIVVMAFAVAAGLRLARFNAAIDVEKPRWQGNYFTGMPAPAGAVTVLLPLYIDSIGLGGFELRSWPSIIMLYTLAMGFLMISTIPTFSGKLAGEKIGRDLVPLIFLGVALCAALLFTYPYVMMSLLTIGYLALIPVSVRRFRWHKEQDSAAALKSATPLAPVVGSEAVPAPLAADDKSTTRH